MTTTSLLARSRPVTHGGNAATAAARHLLGLPPEVRELVYRALLLPDDAHRQQLCVLGRLARHGCCWCHVGFCCRQLYDEVRTFVARRTLRIATRYDSTSLYANVSCLCHLRSFPPRRVCVDINPFQARQTIPKLYATLLSASQCIRGIPRVEVRFDGLLPRRTPPLCVDELDLERAPLHMVVLLVPFRLLRAVGSGRVSIVGGCLDDPWSDYCFLSGCAKRVSRTMEADQPPDSLTTALATELEGALQSGIIWDEQALSQLVMLGLYPRRVLGSPPLNNTVLAELQHRCDICGNHFRFRSQMLTHLSLYHDEPPTMTGQEDT